ncbi:MAG: SHOCT domain-containing protein [Lactobacillus sp.]|nr:SHOCT domain-containing protein [Lactobacillus sp.]MCI2033825.1 SHOCT domain-containing protein [Lactobacillus sp.]
MRVETNKGKNYLDLKPGILYYRSNRGTEKFIPIARSPILSFERPTMMQEGQIRITASNQLIDVVPYLKSDGNAIDRLNSELIQSVFQYENRNSDKNDPNGFQTIRGIKISNNALMVPELFAAASQVIQPDEILTIVLKGMFKELLVVTDKALYINKSGYMTGHLVGQGTFALPLTAITNVSIDFHMMSGYFAVSAGGIQNTQKDFWSSDSRMDPAKSPNTVSVGANTKDDFARAVQLINTTLIPNARNPQVNAPKVKPQNSLTRYDELVKLKELLDADIITQADFDAKKKQILGL